MNRLKMYFVVTALLLCVNLLFAQSKTLTSRDAVGLNRDLYVGSPRNIQWVGNSKKVSYNDVSGVLGVDINGGKRDTLIGLKQLNGLLVDFELPNAKYMPVGEWIDDDRYLFKYENQYLVFDCKSKSLRIVAEVDDRAENTDLSEMQFNVAYTIGNNLYVLSQGNIFQVTNEPEGIVSGQTVHRNEFGISKGTFWSADGQKLAYYKMDERMVTDYPLVDVNKRVAEVRSIKYPMAGMRIHEVELWVYDVVTGKQVLINTGEPREQYLTSVTWDPNGKYVYIGLLNRGQNHLLLNKYDVATGKLVKTLFEEKNDRWVEPENELFFNPAEPNKFVWLSERDGFNHAYYYDTEGNLLSKLTEGDWVITEFKGFDNVGKRVFFMSTENSPIGNQLFSADIKTGKRVLMTPEPGTHNVNVHPTGAYATDSYSNLTTPNVTQLVDNKGHKLVNIQTIDNPLKDYNAGETKIGTILSNMGDSLYYRLITPPNLNPEGKYPAIVYVYGGPHSQMVTNSWLGGGNMYLQYLASLGYVVLTLDNHGTPNRGFEFESIIHRNLGKQEVADQMKGVEFLMSLPYIDKSRIGVDGWSYGGFMTLSLILENPDVFKSATAGGPVCDWSLYEAMYGERYMDTPQENPEGYKAANSIDKIKNLKTKLLVNHGYIDDVVVPQNSLQLLDAAVKNNIQVDFFFYPNHPHNVRGKDRVHLIDKIVEFHNRELM